jgi:hypothetical protein
VSNVSGKLLLKAGDGTWFTILSLSGLTWRWITGKDSAICHQQAGPFVRSFYCSESSEDHPLLVTSDPIYAIPKFTISREKHVTFLEFLWWGVGVGKLHIFDVRRDNPVLRQHSPFYKRIVRKGRENSLFRWNQYLKV